VNHSISQFVYVSVEKAQEQCSQVVIGHGLDVLLGHVWHVLSLFRQRRNRDFGGGERCGRYAIDNEPQKKASHGCKRESAHTEVQLLAQAIQVLQVAATVMGVRAVDQLRVHKMTKEDLVGLNYAHHALHVLLALDEREAVGQQHLVRCIDRVTVYVERALARLACDRSEIDRSESPEVGSAVEGVCHATIGAIRYEVLIGWLHLP
jgi:hypothetical protein